MSRAFQSLILAGVLALFSTAAFSSIVEKPINFSDYKGKWVVISYWATWCSICMGEIPELNAFYKAHTNDVVMFGFNYDDDGNLSKHIQQSGVAFPTLRHDPKGHFKLGRIRGLPTMLIIGPDGGLKHVLTGSQSRQDIENALR
ncbi:putative thiol-disulfide oxidoreductase [Candidatus Rickettsiella viridis]|uniref:Putative thiol-disulfide oxidoreductase n=1 Tax=Candidatus Rickettsiella viridis TaxID=676208 RepID=A0A2Z5UXC7_9COXI|nr:TlpA disulfide reductase family protein [Candidatus Rickettsiella viridis]BBB15713.1 putative thiol-disulfide oxidoreductase [Candidatus Rickettsiella viridis]